MSSDRCPMYAPFFGAMGCACSIVFCCLGAAYGMAKSGAGVATMGISRPEMVMRNLLPVILASIVSIYGLVVSVLISGAIMEGLPLITSFIQLGAGLAVGISGLASGFGIGIIGDVGVRAVGLQPRLYVSMTLMLIFTEVLGLYGMIVALLMLARGNSIPRCT